MNRASSATRVGAVVAFGIATSACSPDDSHALGGAGGIAVMSADTGGATVQGGAGGAPVIMSGGSGGVTIGAGGVPMPSATGGVVAAGGNGAGGSGATGGTGGSDDDGSGVCKTSTSLKPCGTNPDPCGIHTGYPGDEYCMKPPPEGKGIQIHFGPKDYTDPAEVAKYVLKPGQEVNTYWATKIPLPDDHWFIHTKIQMRPGSHHLINSVVSGDIQDGFTNTTQCPGDMVSGFPGSQTLVQDSPPGGVPAPENVGLGLKLAGSSNLCVNHHGYNFSDGDQLREVWMNIWFVDESEVTQEGKGVFLSAGPYMGIPAHSTKVLTYAATVPADGRILTLLGHRHVWTDRFAVFKNDQLVYDSWSWQEAASFDYDSITTNPPLDPAGKKDGAFSGDLFVKAGDKLSIECDVNNTSDNTITFKNQLYGGEMCLLFGGSVGTEIISAF